MADRKLVPADQRFAVHRELRELLEIRDKHGKYVWNQTTLARALGGISQQAVHKAAADPSGVSLTVRDRVLRKTGMTIEDLLTKHPAPPDTLESPPSIENAQRVLARHVEEAERNIVGVFGDKFSVADIASAVRACALRLGWTNAAQLAALAGSELEKRAQAGKLTRVRESDRSDRHAHDVSSAPPALQRRVGQKPSEIDSASNEVPRAGEKASKL